MLTVYGQTLMKLLIAIATNYQPVKTKINYELCKLLECVIDQIAFLLLLQLQRMIKNEQPQTNIIYFQTAEEYFLSDYVAYSMLYLMIKIFRTR